MWSILNGTIVNAGTVVLGSCAGVAMSARLPERYRTIVLATLGLVTITLGIDASVLKFGDMVTQFAPAGDAGKTYGARVAIVMISCLLVGAILGTAMRLHDRVEGLGRWIHGRFSRQDGHAFAEGFLTASVIFCVGPLTLLGCLENGASGDPSLLYIKSLLDGFCAMALASTLGWGVLGSVLTILVFQGGLAVLASQVAEPLHPFSKDLMTVVGGVILLATALMILDIKRLPVADMLPALFLPPLAVAIIEWVSPGTLLPLG